MLQQLKQSGRLELTLMLVLMCGFCFTLSVVRVLLTGSPLFLFLNWNLFLAFIPWLATTLIMLNERWQKRKTALFLALFTWILFFANAPYILTDLFHLRIETTVPIWYDLTLILSFAWTGLAFGFISLMDIEKLMHQRLALPLVSDRLTRPLVTLAVIIILFGGSFGVYVGRYLRWNSWDVFSNPFSVFYDIASRFVNPMSHPRTWGMTILFGILLNLMFWTVKFIRKEKAL